MTPTRRQLAQGGWLAGAGNLGLACWDDDGTRRFVRGWSNEP